MNYISIIALLTITVLSCNSASESKDAVVQAPSKKNETACDCIEVMRTTLEGITTLEEFLNVEVTLQTAAPECEEIMTNPSAQDFVMINCIEAANDLEIAANKKMESFMEEMSDQGMISDAPAGADAGADADADSGADADAEADAGTK